MPKFEVAETATVERIFVIDAIDMDDAVARYQNDGEVTFDEGNLYPSDWEYDSAWEVED